MFTGLNHNIKHAGRIFHIQTEDSGRQYARVTSHLFLGGNILASEQTEYRDKLDLAPDPFEEAVREIMRQSHKTMIHKLVTGEYDHLTDDVDNGFAPLEPLEEEMDQVEDDDITTLADRVMQDDLSDSLTVDRRYEDEDLDADPHTLNLYTLMGIKRKPRDNKDGSASIGLRESILAKLGEPTEVDRQTKTRG